jgi:hypothetical protein
MRYQSNYSRLLEEKRAPSRFWSIMLPGGEVHSVTTDSPVPEWTARRLLREKLGLKKLPAHSSVWHAGENVL